MRVTTTTGMLVTTLLWAGLASAQLTPQASLKKCQDTVAKASQKYIDGQLKAVTKCLSKASSEILGQNAPNIDGAVAICAKELRKLYDTRGLGKSLKEQFVAAVRTSCEPGQPDVTHTLEDLLGPGATAAESMQVGNLDTFCSSNSGPVIDVTSWINCIELTSSYLAVPQLIAVRFPRAVSWLALLNSTFDLSSSPPSDPGLYVDLTYASGNLKVNISNLIFP